MKVTKSQLIKIIKEELSALSESEAAKELKQLQDLAKAGELSPEEFKAQKQALLQKAPGAQQQGGDDAVLAGSTRMATAGGATTKQDDGTVAAGATRMANEPPDYKPGDSSASGATRMASGENQKLQSIAKQLQILLQAIQKELQ